MKKNKKLITKKTKQITPMEALNFLETMRKMSFEVDEPAVLISIRVPQNVLRALKLKAKADGKKYQSLMIELVRKGLRETI